MEQPPQNLAPACTDHVSQTEPRRPNEDEPARGATIKAVPQTVRSPGGCPDGIRRQDAPVPMRGALRPCVGLESVSDDAEVLERAIHLACEAHRGQRYPSPEAEPYIQHPLRVMLAVRGFRAQAVAMLHDVLEDTTVTVDDLHAAGLADDVIDAVIALTHRPPQP